MPPGSLGQVLQKLGTIDHPDLLAGHRGFEDAGIFRLDSERALVQTVDFFPPICDDPRWFGRIAAANSLSAARPGARREQLASYIKRLDDLELICKRFGGVERAYALQAGREIRVMVMNDQIDDAQAVVMSKEIARAIENETYLAASGQCGSYMQGNSQRLTYGHSMIVDPWGHVVAKASDGPGVVTSRIDTGRVKQVRDQIPVHQHRKLPIGA